MFRWHPQPQEDYRDNRFNGYTTIVIIIVFTIILITAGKALYVYLQQF